MRGWASSGVAYQGGSREGGLRPKSCAVGRRIHRRHGGGVGLRFREARRERPRERGDPARIACAEGLSVVGRISSESELKSSSEALGLVQAQTRRGGRDTKEVVAPE